MDMIEGLYWIKGNENDWDFLFVGFKLNLMSFWGDFYNLSVSKL